MSDDPLHSAKYVLEHANRRISEFEREVTLFLDSEPYARVIEDDPYTGGQVAKVKLVKPLPAALPGIVFDALNNMRACLDQIGFATSKAADSNFGKHAHFPFGDSEANSLGHYGGGSKQIPKQIFDVMVAFRPYETGDKTLWAINKLCNTKKHEIIVPVCVASGAKTTYNNIRIRGAGIEIGPMWDSTKGEIELARVGAGGSIEFDVSLTYYIAFTDVIGLGGAPVDRILRTMARKVNDILVAVEAEAFRLGLFK
jgi:hypothetical protein